MALKLNVLRWHCLCFSKAVNAKHEPKQWWPTRIVCAWCVKEGLADDTPHSGEVVSHGICDRHRDRMIADMNQMELPFAPFRDRR